MSRMTKVKCAYEKERRRPTQSMATCQLQQHRTISEQHDARPMGQPHPPSIFYQSHQDIVLRNLHCEKDSGNRHVSMQQLAKT